MQKPNATTNKLRKYKWKARLAETYAAGLATGMELAEEGKPEKEAE